MARIRASRSGSTVRVRISGALRAADLGRLEHNCASALTVEPLPLELDLRRVTAIDASASAVLARMHERGARIVYAEHVPGRRG